MPTELADRPQLWGGVECSIVRIRNRWRDQCAETGHRHRSDDLESIAELGIETLRYPVLWESVAPGQPHDMDFSWHDGRLHKLRQLRIDPIVGLLHHGSGPRYTELLDPAFPDLLAAYAGQVAARYPWVNRFTPINEPLTTARFSCLYGHWYPHRRSTRDFARALINQCRAIVLAMRAIRAINPDATLVQTEDLGKAFSTALLQYQADYENERRWLTFDLLLGQVDRAHPSYKLFLDHGIEEEELQFFIDEPCAPEILGINHYLTSERFLEHRRANRPPGHRMSGNGRHQYADLEAVRTSLPSGSTGPEARLREVWARYQRPIAITETHHGSTRDEQLRWLVEMWDAASALRAEGKDICAVTVWALFGVMDWNSLLVKRNGCYEAGAFDIRSPVPRLTAVGRSVRKIVAEGCFDHPVLDTPGWWHRDQRFYASRGLGAPCKIASARSIAVVGASSHVADAFRKTANLRGLAHTIIPVGAHLERHLAENRTWAIVDLSGLTQNMPGSPRGPDNAAAGITGESLPGPYARQGLPQLSFARDKAFRVGSHCLQVQTGSLFGPWERENFIVRVLKELAAGRELVLSRSNMVSATYIPDMFDAALDLLIDGARGVWCLINSNDLSWFDFGQSIARNAGLNPALVRPELTAVSAERGQEQPECVVMPPLTNALWRFLRDSEAAWRPSQLAAE
jgi:dTDP-4-dehydrorhamnose reductase